MLKRKQIRHYSWGISAPQSVVHHHRHLHMCSALCPVHVRSISVTLNLHIRFARLCVYVCVCVLACALLCGVFRHVGYKASGNVCPAVSDGITYICIHVQLHACSIHAPFQFHPSSTEAPYSNCVIAYQLHMRIISGFRHPEEPT